MARDQVNRTHLYVPQCSDATGKGREPESCLPGAVAYRWCTPLLGATGYLTPHSHQTAYEGLPQEPSRLLRSTGAWQTRLGARPSTARKGRPVVAARVRTKASQTNSQIYTWVHQALTYHVLKTQPAHDVPSMALVFFIERLKFKFADAAMTGHCHIDVLHRSLQSNPGRDDAKLLCFVIAVHI